MAAVSAKYARVEFHDAGLFLRALKWTVNTKVDEVDVSSFEDFGYTNWIGGLWDADISFDAFWDTTDGSPFTAGPILVPGNTATNVRFYLSNSAYAAATGLNVQVPPISLPTTYWNFSQILITQVNMDTEVRSYIKFSVMAKNKGFWVAPT